jgi:hypothetical protein
MNYISSKNTVLGIFKTPEFEDIVAGFKNSVDDNFSNLAISQILEETGDVCKTAPTTIHKFGRSADIDGVAETLVTALAKSNLRTLYDELSNLSYPAPTAAPSGIYLAGNYLFPASAMGITVKCDAAGDPNARFVFKLTGALSTAATSEVQLSNGAQACNIYWLTTNSSAIALTSSNQLYGTFISSAAASMGAGSLLEGRLTSIAGAITPTNAVVSIPSGDSFYDLGIVKSFALFTSSGAITNTGTTAVVGNVGSNLGLVSGFTSPSSIDGITYIDTDRLGTVTLGTVSRMGYEETYLTTNTIDRIVSSDSLAWTDVTIEGHTMDGTGLLTSVVQTINLNGQIDVPLVTPLARISRIFNSGTTYVDGELTVFDSTGTSSSGVVLPKSAIHITMDKDSQQSQKCETSFSNTEYGILTQFQGGQSSKSTALVEFRLEVRERGSVWRTRYQWAASVNTSEKLSPYLIIPKNADVRVKAVSNTANLEVHANMNFIVAKVE